MNSKIAFVSAMLALAATAADPQPAQAAPKGFSQQLCEDLGYEWNVAWGCVGCSAPGGVGGVKPGAKATCQTTAIPPKPVPCHCTLSGDWVMDKPFTGPSSTGPVAPPPREIAPLPLLTPPGPGAPLPLRKAP